MVAQTLRSRGRMLGPYPKDNRLITVMPRAGDHGKEYVRSDRPGAQGHIGGRTVRSWSTVLLAWEAFNQRFAAPERV